MKIVTPMMALQNIGVNLSLFTEILIKALGQLSVPKHSAEYFLEPAIRHMTIENFPANLDLVSRLRGGSGDFPGRFVHQVVIGQLKNGRFIEGSGQLKSFRQCLLNNSATEEDLLVVLEYHLVIDERNSIEKNELKVYPYLSVNRSKKLRRKIVDKVHKIPQDQLIFLAAATEIN